MKKYYFLILILISTFSFGQELLLNGGFELWDDSTSPTSWSKAESTEQESTIFHGGSFSAKHTGGTSDISQTVSGIVPGKSYTITIWYKVESGTGDGDDARIWSYWRNGNSNVTDAASDAALRGPNNAYFDNNGNEWTEYKTTVTAPVGVDSFYFEVRTYSGAVVYWDDFSFFEEAIAVPTLSITSPSDGANLTSGDVDVEVSVLNFNVATTGNGDGHLHYYVDGSGTPTMKFDTTPLSLTGLTPGEHTVDVELVDDSHDPLSSPITASVTFTVLTVQSLPIYDGLDYTESENLGDQMNWHGFNSGDGIVISSGSLSYTGLLESVGNSATFGGAGMESQVNFDPVTSGTLYASFIFKVTDQTAITDLTDGGYFAYFSVPGDFNFKSRVWAHPNPDAAGTTFDIGFGNVSSSPAVSPSTYNVGDDVFVVVSYELGTGLAKIWINPLDTDLGADTAPTETFSEADPGTVYSEISQFNLRQDSDIETPLITFDELRVGTNWAEVTPVPTASIGKTEIEGFAIYPNPVSNGEFSIRTNGGVSKSVQIFDMLGKQVYSKEVQANENVRISNLNAGIYILKVKEEDKVATRKLVVE